MFRFILHNIMLRVLRLFFFTELCINIKYKRVDGEGGEAMTLNGSSGVQCKILKCYQLLFFTNLVSIYSRSIRVHSMNCKTNKENQ